MKHAYKEKQIKGIVLKTVHSGKASMQAKVLILRASKDELGETLSVSDDEDIMFSIPMRDFRAIIEEIDKEYGK